MKSPKEVGQSSPQVPPHQATIPNQDGNNGGHDDDDDMMGDERPIRGGATSTFEELIEKQLRLEEEKVCGERKYIFSPFKVGSTLYVCSTPKDRLSLFKAF